MNHAIHRVEYFEIVGPYTLALRFDDGSEQRIDFRPVLEGEVFAPLQDLDVFNTGRTGRHVRDIAVAEWCRFRSRDASRLAQISR